MAENLWPAGEVFARESAVEVVGLGYRLRTPVAPPEPFAPLEPGLRWATLVNEAARMQDEFYVSGGQFRGVLLALQDEFGEGNVALEVLWHSHLSNVNPSVFDTANFPRWAVSYGAIYHVPTNRTTLYDERGVLEPDQVRPTLAQRA